MEPIFLFVIRASAGIVLFYAVYWLFLRNETMYHTNRLFIMGALAASILLPAFPLQYTVLAEPNDNTVVFQPLNEAFQNIRPVDPRHSETPSEPGFMSILTIVYGIGAFLVLSRLVIQTGMLVHLRMNSKTTSYEGISVAENDRYEVAFSFFNTVFINPKFIKQADLPYIIAHEKVHIREVHWFDLFVIDLFTVLFWFNPFIWFFERSIRQNHEYLADKGVIARGHPERQYRALLINQAMGVSVVGPTHCLNYSLNKNRFKMMKKKKTPGSGSLKLLMALPVLAAMIYVCAEPNPKLKEQQENENMEVEPRLQDQVKLTGKVLDEQGNPIPGVNVVVKGTTTGTTTGMDGIFELQVTPGKELALSYVGKESIVDDLSGISATKNQVHREYTMKTGVFHIDRDKYFSKKPASKNRQKKDHSVASSDETSGDKNKVIFIVVEDMPTYPGGFYELGKYVKGMEQKLSGEQNVRGEALVGFTVDENGQVTDIRILEKDNDAAARHAADIVSGMEDWKPGLQRGQPVPVHFTLPVKFE